MDGELCGNEFVLYVETRTGPKDTQSDLRRDTNNFIRPSTVACVIVVSKYENYLLLWGKIF